MDFGSWSNYSIKWSIFRRLTKFIILTFDQVKSVKKFNQVISELSIKWKNTILIKWNSIKWSFAHVEMKLSNNSFFLFLPSSFVSASIILVSSLKCGTRFYIWHFVRRTQWILHINCRDQHSDTISKLLLCLVVEYLKDLF